MLVFRKILRTYYMNEPYCEKKVRITFSFSFNALVTHFPTNFLILYSMKIPENLGFLIFSLGIKWEKLKKTN